MPAGYTKEDVEFHTVDNSYSPNVPAINVKVYHYPDAYDVSEAFSCSEEIAEQALGYAFESAQERFWVDDMPLLIDRFLKPHFGERIQGFSSGRSAGWLTVEGIDDPHYAFEDPIYLWDAIDLTAWYAFEKAVKTTVKWYCSWEYVREDIESNRWAEDGAERYNYYEFTDGRSECFVDIKEDGAACPDRATVLIQYAKIPD